ncbi:MAG: hypothetical protein AAGJ19_01055 [Myxococcota bacterium]
MDRILSQVQNPSMERPRALGFGAALEAGFQIQATAWRWIAALHVAWAAPLSVLHLAVAFAFGQDFEGALRRMAQSQRLDPELLPFVLAMSALAIVQSFSGLVLREGLARGFGAELLGRGPFDTLALFSWLKRSLGGAAMTAFILQLVLLGAFVLGLGAVGLGSAIVGGGAALGSLPLTILGGFLGAVAAFLGLFFAAGWALRACLAPVVHAVEEGTGPDAIARSRVLLREGGTGRIFVVLLGAALGAGALGQGLAILMGAGVEAPGPWLAAARTVAFLFAWLPFEAYFSRVLTLLYFDRRARLGEFEPASRAGSESDA